VELKSRDFVQLAAGLYLGGNVKKIQYSYGCATNVNFVFDLEEIENSPYSFFFLNIRNKFVYV
jgi:hypothetical protein